MGYIYGLICPIINEIRYVGMTTKSLYERKRGHINKFKKNINGKKSHKEAWFKSLYNINILNDIKIIEIEECDNDILYDREKFWIEKYINDGYKLTNLKDGGNNSSGYRLSPRSDKDRINISNSLKEFWKGFKGTQSDKLRTNRIRKTLKERYGENFSPYMFMSDEQKKSRNEKASESIKGHKNPFHGKKHSEESKQKIRENRPDITGERNHFYGKTHSEETKRKISDKLVNKLVKPLLAIDEKGKIVNYFTEVDKLLLFTNTKDKTNVSRKANKNIPIKGYFYYHITENLHNLYKENFGKCILQENYDFIHKNNLNVLLYKIN